MRRWPVSTFFVLAFAITWAVWVPRALDIDWANGLGTFWTYGPAAAAILAAVIVGGRPELRQLLSGLDKWRIGWLWYAVILLGPLALGLLVAAVNTALGGSWDDGMPQALSEPLPIVLLLLVILTVTDGLGEELGWRGFALPRMLDSHNAFAASIVLGIVWAIWHLPLIWTDGNALEETYIWLLVVRLPATSILFTWVYQHTNRSVVAAAIFHGSLNLFSVAPPTPGDPLTPAVIAVVSHWIIALLLVLLAGGHRLDGFPSQPVETPDA
jgi:membrane protease YdiL (CAAX protease family)